MLRLGQIKRKDTLGTEILFALSPFEIGRLCYFERTWNKLARIDTIRGIEDKFCPTLDRQVDGIVCKNAQ